MRVATETSYDPGSGRKLALARQNGTSTAFELAESVNGPDLNPRNLLKTVKCNSGYHEWHKNGGEMSGSLLQKRIPR